MLEPPRRQSFFFFGPRGVGKTAWLRARFPDALVFDLLESETYTRLLAAPSRLADQIPATYKGWVVPSLRFFALDIFFTSISRRLADDRVPYGAA